MSPPKSPLAEEGSLSRTSSVELLNPEHFEEKSEIIEKEFVDNYLSSLPIPPPGMKSVIMHILNSLILLKVNKIEAFNLFSLISNFIYRFL